MEERREGRGLSRRREEYLSMGCPVKRITSSTKDEYVINTYTTSFFLKKIILPCLKC